MEYATAYGLKGFKSSSLRVRVERLEGDYAWVCTADLRDVGTKLVLDVSQLEEEWEWEEVVSHPAGLVGFAGC